MYNRAVIEEVRFRTMPIKKNNTIFANFLAMLPRLPVPCLLKSEAFCGRQSGGRSGGGEAMLCLMIGCAVLFGIL